MHPSPYTLLSRCMRSNCTGSDEEFRLIFNLGSSHIFTPMAIETCGVVASLDFNKKLGHRVKQVIGEEKAHRYLIQRLSVAVQRGNSLSDLGLYGS